jgi:hypothetical protein
LAGPYGSPHLFQASLYCGLHPLLDNDYYSVPLGFYFFLTVPDLSLAGLIYSERPYFLDWRSAWHPSLFARDNRGSKSAIITHHMGSKPWDTQFSTIHQFDQYNQSHLTPAVTC